MAKRQRGSEVSNQADVARRGLVSVNRLDYTLQPDLSVAVARSSKKHFFQQNTYTPTQRAICILNSGAEYFDPQNSYLRFDVALPVNASAKNTNGLNLGAGSGCNFIRQLTLTSRSGDEIERIEQVNHLAVQLDRYMNSPEWLNTQGEVIGYLNASETVGATTEQAYPNRTYGTSGVAGSSTNHSLFKPDTASGAQTKASGKFCVVPTTTESVVSSFVIPLSCLSGMFKSFDRLVPSMLASGLRIEIEFETATDVGQWGSGITTPSYTIINPEIVLDQYQLTDSIMRVLNEEAALRGLEVVFSTWYNHDVSFPAASTSGNIQIRKAVSRALGILTRISLPRGVGPTYDNFLARKADFTKYQVRVGALYFPQQGISSTSVTRNLTELYHHTLRGLGKWKTPSAPTGVPFMDFRGKGQAITGVYDATGGNASETFVSIYTDLERSNTQKLTGIPVNNARVAEVFFTRAAADADVSRVNCYLHYVKLLRVFLQNVEVEE